MKYTKLNFYSTGADSGRVVIWNMEPIKDEAAELNQNIPKMLCQIDNHLGVLNFFCKLILIFIIF